MNHIQGIGYKDFEISLYRDGDNYFTSIKNKEGMVINSFEHYFHAVAINLSSAFIDGIEYAENYK